MKRFLKITGLALCALVLLVAASCEKQFERRPLYELSNTHYVRVYVDTTILNVTTGFYDLEGPRVRPEFENPEVLRLMLADGSTGNSRSERFLQHIGYDEYGLYYDGYVIADPGDYALLAYNFGTQSSILRNPYQYKGIEAYINSISESLLSKLPSYIRQQNAAAAPATTSDESSDDESKAQDFQPIVYAPDHLFVATSDHVYIPSANHIDTIFVNRQNPLADVKSETVDEFPVAETVVESYYIQLRVRGAKYVSSIVGLISGMGGSQSLVSGELDDLSTIYLEMLTTEEDEEGVATLYTTFNTFGRLDQAENEFKLNFDIVTVDGRGHTVEVGNIADEFMTPDAIEHRWLIIEKIIEVPEPVPGEDNGGVGGFSPYVTDWETVEDDILI